MLIRAPPACDGLCLRPLVGLELISNARPPDCPDLCSSNFFSDPSTTLKHLALFVRQTEGLSRPV